ncbi:hypothetical protein [Pseudonocardia kunmingensis]|uniref:Lipoprotein n=1 Tax=Pseudonocardia kunmingensis TaxID=630975 RepID=A0A543DAZ1_9PSEU|nr:hypothetical protein [Pseudonocardia kunmingensis]TQM06507.1 hypothetical protein FB558_6767 [Pseudonocardia kunmingensis]
MPSLRVLAAAAALLLCGGCATTEAPPAAPAAAPAPAHCAETTATPTGERPPALASSTSGWFGQDDLWVGLPDYPPAAQGDALVLRFPVVTLDDGAPTDERGAPVVTAERVDAAGEAPGQVGAFAHAYGTGELSFWPASVVFPDPGCWAVTGLLGTASLQFTVAVAAP